MSEQHPFGTWSDIDGVRTWTPPHTLRLRPSYEFLITTGLVGGVFSLGILFFWVAHICWMQPASMDQEGITLRRGGRIPWEDVNLNSQQVVNAGTGGGGSHRRMAVGSDGRRAFLWGLKGEWEAWSFATRQLGARSSTPNRAS